MQPVPPFWFVQRQGKLEEAGANTFRLTAPNQQEALISIAPAEGRWSAAVRVAADGPNVAATDPAFETPQDAWQGAFELYRKHVII